MPIDLNTPAAVADFLEHYNGWRRGGFDDDGNPETPPPMPHPKDIGRAIEAAVAMLRAGTGRPIATAEAADRSVNPDRRLSDDLQRIHDSGDFGRGLEGYPERALALEARVERLQRECAAKQARIDELMLEWCPGEMTPEQLADWEAHQKVHEPPNAALTGHQPKE